MAHSSNRHRSSQIYRSASHVKLKFKHTFFVHFCVFLIDFSQKLAIFLFFLNYCLCCFPLTNTIIRERERKKKNWQKIVERNARDHFTTYLKCSWWYRKRSEPATPTPKNMCSICWKHIENYEIALCWLLESNNDIGQKIVLRTKSYTLTLFLINGLIVAVTLFGSIVVHLWNENQN